LKRLVFILLTNQLRLLRQYLRKLLGKENRIWVHEYVYAYNIVTLKSISWGEFMFWN
jgi:hypothetical protein